MKKLQRTAGKLIQRVVDRATGSGLMQEETAAAGTQDITPGIPEAIRQAAAEGCVLLKNDGALPLDPDREIAVFGRCQLDWFYVGFGSGGDVHAPYRVNLIDGLDRAGAAYNRTLAGVYRAWTELEDNRADQGWWGHWPTCRPEMPLAPPLVEGAARTAGTAVVVIGRAAGEDRENSLEKGGYYLTDGERAMLRAVTGSFRHTVVILNTGGVMDLSWVKEFRPSAVLLAWQGGMESGNAVCDVLYGKVNPCGKLPDTIAKRYRDYPSAANFGGEAYNVYAEDIFVGYRFFDTVAPGRVLYPFGFGLSYTTFQVTPVSFLREDGVTVTAEVRNTGDRPGKEVVQLYVSQQPGGLRKAKRVLAAFGKTKELQPGEAETVTLSCGARYLASYDQTRHAFVLEAGEYRFTLNGVSAGSFRQEELLVVEQCEAVCSPEVDLKGRITERLPAAVPAAAWRGITFGQVLRGEAELDDFTAQLSREELEGLTRGHGMMGSPLGAPGNAGVLGGVLPELREKGVPPVTCCDGPAGIRLGRYCALLPCGTALAAGWNTELTEALYRLVGAEMKRCGADILLAPGMNIHRNPLCGRNFEYFSEDPVLSGKMAAAVVRGVQSQGVGCCPKHFACNNQETRRNTNDSRVSQRALREIYLRGFEICVREAKPLAVMTSYNKVNGVWAHYHYDLATTVLRGEWGYEGAVMTDWWMQRARSPEFPQIRDNAYRVRAQVDVLMPGNMGRAGRKYRSDGTLLETLGLPGGITLGEIQRSAKNVLRLILALKAPGN